MDWNALLSMIAVVAFVLLMMRGCGGMMTRGGCGMGVHHTQKRRDTPPGGPTGHAAHDTEAR
jgi:hypothetical protein